MSVIPIWKVQFRLYRRNALLTNFPIWSRQTHFVAATKYFTLFGGHFFGEVAHPFPLDSLTPLCSKEPSSTYGHQRIRFQHPIENAGVYYGGVTDVPSHQ